jgi:uncharacterized membrane protein YedE/YeeE
MSARAWTANRTENASPARSTENPWWRDVLAHGPSSAQAEAFDIDWDRFGGRLLLPVLGDAYGAVLARGDITVTVDMLMILSVIVGSFIAAKLSGDFRLRWPKVQRLHNPVVGGLLMGVGSRLAPGCNIANLFSGVALLSLHSILAGAGIILGTYVMTHYLYREVGCAI